MARLASFSDVIYDRFYDELHNALSAHIEDNPASCGFRTRLVSDPQEVELQDYHIKFTDVTGTVSDELAFDVIVEAEAEIAETHHGERISDSTEQWYRISCSCDISNGIKNLRISDIKVYYRGKGQPKFGRLSDYLVPIIRKEELDMVAEQFLRQYYPEALLQPTPVNTSELARRMGLTIRAERITKSASVFGQVFFADCMVPVYDPEKDAYQDIAIEEGTMLVDPEVFFMRVIGSFNNTIVHECVHWGLHRRFFELEKLYEPEAKAIVCHVYEGTKPEKDRSPYEWMEWQASHLAPRILMPAKQTRAKVEELLKAFGHLSPQECMAAAVSGIADFFAVSKQSAKIRLIDLGYSDAIGVFNYVDDRYVDHHAATKTMKPGQTFIISAEDAAVQYTFNPVFKEMLSSGRYVYASPYFCVNAPKYVERDAFSGTLHLTEYARSHMDECCLSFDLSYKRNNNYGVKHYTECALFRDAVEASIPQTAYSHSQANAAVDSRAINSPELKKRIAQIASIQRTLPSSFEDTLIAHMTRLQLTNEELAARCGISEKTVQRFRQPNRGRPTMQTAVALCVGLRLHPILGRDLLAKAGITFRPGSEEDVSYALVVDTMTEMHIYEVNETLRSLNVKPLSKDE